MLINQQGWAFINAVDKETGQPIVVPKQIIVKDIYDDDTILIDMLIVPIGSNVKPQRVPKDVFSATLNEAVEKALLSIGRKMFPFIQEMVRLEGYRVDSEEEIKVSPALVLRSYLRDLMNV